ncbi:MAG: redoxin domain-containing protein [Firmicutes bacterium]|nr:redoxin domain-containing protein [Bacillota bacterium]
MKGAARAWRWAVAAVLLVTAFAVFAYGQAQESRAAVGRPAPEWTLPAMDGGRLSLAALRGRPVVLNFFASWCDVCAVEAPALQAFARRYGDRVSVVGIDWREPWSAVRPFVQRFGDAYPVVRDADGAVARAYRLTGVPETWVLDESGTARAHVAGGLSFEDLQTLYARATGRSIDGRGVPPVAAGDRALSLARSGSRLWVGTDRGLFTSADAGRTWTQAPAPPGPVTQLVSGPGGAPVAAVAGGRLWVGLAGGRPEAAGLAGPVAAAALWIDADHLAAWTESGLWVAPLQDAARKEAWRRIAHAAALPDAPRALIFTVDGRGLAATGVGVFRTADAGRTWEDAGFTQQRMDLRAWSSPMDILREEQPLQASGLAAGAGGTVALATDGGVWSAQGDLRQAAPLPGSPARRFAAAIIDADGVWALAPNGDIYLRPASGKAPAPFGAVDAGGGWLRLLPGG